LLALVVLLAGGCSAPTAAPTSAPTAAATAPAGLIPLKAAYPQASAVQAALFVARDAGFFERQGLDVSLSMIGGNAQVPALINNEIQVAALGANEVANAAVGGAQLVMIATCSDLPVFSLYANPSYSSVAELAGQTVGVTAPGTSTDAAAHLFLKHFGLEGQVRIAGSGGTIPGVLAALTQGGIAGGILSPPTTQQAADAGFRELVNGVKLGVPMNHSGIAITRDYARAHADEVNRFLRAYRQAWSFAADPANRATVVQAIARYSKSDEPLAQVGYDAVAPVWQGTAVPRVNPEAVSNLLALSENPQVQAMRPEQIIDNTLIDAAT
jgi:ABC-type nitrate/sulfonate/bicarbonate transport system substrate-binding protein